MRQKFLCTILLILLLFTLCVSCNNDELDTIKIRIPWLHQAQYAGVYVAKEKGFFKKYGIEEVEILQGGPNIRPVDLVSSGSEHFSITGSMPFFNAYKEGRPIKVIATLDQKHAYCYFARADQNIDEPKDFKGERVAHKVAHEHNLEALLKSAGLTKQDIKLVPVPPGMSLFFTDDPEKMVPIWAGHAADEPLKSIERGIDVNYFFPEDYDGKPRIGNILFTSKDFEKKHPEIVEGVVKGILEAWYYSFNNLDEAVDITMKYMKGTDADKKHQKNMLIKMKDFMLIEKYGEKIGWSNQDKWGNAVENFVKNNKDASFSLNEILTNKYVESFYNDDNVEYKTDIKKESS
ncbi:MAG: ABC transporter substrate-binding protein [Spirochaetota bacterium]